MGGIDNGVVAFCKEQYIPYLIREGTIEGTARENDFRFYDVQSGTPVWEFRFFGYSAEGLFHAAMLAWLHGKDLMARPSMRMKRGGSHAGIRIEVGLRECEARSNPCNPQKFSEVTHP